jgi:hypothetical protein
MAACDRAYNIVFICSIRLRLALFTFRHSQFCIHISLTWASITTCLKHRASLYMHARCHPEERKECNHLDALHWIRYNKSVPAGMPALCSWAWVPILPQRCNNLSEICDLLYAYESTTSAVLKALSYGLVSATMIMRRHAPFPDVAEHGLVQGCFNKSTHVGRSGKASLTWLMQGTLNIPLAGCLSLS